MNNQKPCMILDFGFISDKYIGYPELVQRCLPVSQEGVDIIRLLGMREIVETVFRFPGALPEDDLFIWEHIEQYRPDIQDYIHKSPWDVVQWFDIAIAELSEEITMYIQHNLDKHRSEFGYIDACNYVFYRWVGESEKTSLTAAFVYEESRF